MLSGENGIIRQASKAKEETEKGSWNEQKQLIIMGYQIDKLSNLNILSYLQNSFKEIDNSATVTDVGNGYYVQCGNNKCYFDYDLNEYDVNEGDTSFWKYSENDDGTLTIIGYNWTPSGEIIIPNIINDKRVRDINCSFRYNTDLTSMKISYGIENIIGGNLFADCTNLTGNINLPSSLKVIGYGAFTRCSQLTGDLNLVNVTEIQNHAFNSCSGLNGSLYMNQNGSIVGYYSFRGCKNLKGTAIVSNFSSTELTSAGASFTDCESLENLILKNTITIIPYCAFNSCNNLKEIKIPQSVEKIGQQAFYNCSKAKILSINSDIHEIGGRAFQNCNSLDCTIQLSSSTIIAEKAFDNCGNLKIERIN